MYVRGHFLAVLFDKTKVAFAFRRYARVCRHRQNHAAAPFVYGYDKANCINYVVRIQRV
ncbi:hypothetical protein WH47_11226 [Habropoda laboriosa]|uniref:Uncharacterized protein n=1 Tax=Habropoda laboriosa TaxID=597456 RepID=A0A0L7QKQ8_9HYME|nr:hypothetical protein WH47_11226 [Habropoda laboriosa]